MGRLGGELLKRMTDSSSPSFAFCVESDAYSSAGKIMGRQMAGEGFLRGVGRTWPKAVLQGVVTGPFDRQDFLNKLGASGFQGELRLSRPPGFKGAIACGALYYPTIPAQSLARFRNRLSPAAFSLFGVTHTIASDRALDTIAEMASAPFMPWDALICTSPAAKQVADALIEEAQDDLRRYLGATRLEAVQTPVIPLGVNCDEWTVTPDQKAQARANLGIAADEVVFLFAGRLTFHAKANPAALYQALQAASGAAKLVLIEAGMFRQEPVRDAFLAAQAELAPDVRFIHAPGDDPQAYADAWRAADVFTSLSDNVQETFGLTPVQAMAAGLPVVATDWNGYRSTVRDGIDGVLIPTVAAPPGAGDDLAVAVESNALSYDRCVGLLSLGVAVDRRLLEATLIRLATDTELRARMGAAGQRRAREVFDWTVVLGAYDALGRELTALRSRNAESPARPWRQRSDPFSRFEGFASRTVRGDDMIALCPDGEARLEQIAQLNLANFSFHPELIDRACLAKLVAAVGGPAGRTTTDAMLKAAGGASPMTMRALMWLLKFRVIEIRSA